MKERILLKIFSAFTVFFLSFVTIFADYGLKVSEQTSTSAKISWDKDAKAQYYQLNYKAGGKTNQTDLIDTTSYNLTNLTPGEKYSVTLVGIDSDGGEIFKSKELDVTLDSATATTASADKASAGTKDSTDKTATTDKTTKADKSTFSITKASLTKENVLTLTFSKNLNTAKLTDAEFKVESINDSSDYLKVKSVTAVKGDKKSVDLEFEGTPTTGVEYKVVALAIFDEDNNNIKFGVDSETRFTGGNLATQKDETKANMNAAGPSDNNTTTKTEDKKDATDSKQDSTDNKDTTTKEKRQLSGTSGTKKDTGKNVEAISENKDKLPKTGPEMVIIAVLAFILSASFFFLRK
ncbi:fibronectin type III domain-containing protein [Candidatus Gracilibacteria bacterium]|nr:fibronectin type III domain-containing protein [Candidatus Gracilibacteria bacterium]